MKNSDAAAYLCARRFAVVTEVEGSHDIALTRVMTLAAPQAGRWHGGQPSKAFISFTACSRPTRTARAIMLCPILYSTISGMWVKRLTLR